MDKQAPDNKSNAAIVHYGDTSLFYLSVVGGQDLLTSTQVNTEGILQNAIFSQGNLGNPFTKIFRFNRGDILVLTSDGVSIEGDQINRICRDAVKNGQDPAQLLVNDKGNHNPDDRSALVIYYKPQVVTFKAGH